MVRIPTPNHVSFGAVLLRRKNMFSWSTGEPEMTPLHCLDTLCTTKRDFNGKYDRMSSRSSHVPKTAIDRVISPFGVSLVVVILRFCQCCQWTAASQNDVCGEVWTDLVWAVAFRDGGFDGSHGFE